MKLIKNYLYYFALPILMFFVLFSQSINAQSYDRIEKDRMKSILKNIKSKIEKTYYDEKYHGIDLDAHFKKAEEKLNNSTSVGHAFGIIAQALMDFDDSHLTFYPPAITTEVEYGFDMKPIGDKVFITSVKPKSDAEKKGLRAGDELLLMEGFRPTRKDLWKMNYYYNVLNPKTKLTMKVLHPESNEPKIIEFDAKLTQSKKRQSLWNSADVNDLIRESGDYANRAFSYRKKIGNTTIWKLKTFSFDPSRMSDLINDEVLNSQNLIIDLRDNGGGYVKNLEEIAGYLVKNETKIADRQGREDKKKENEAMMAKKRGDKTFTGNLIILVDSRSASASEILARFVQLEKRGRVVGDVSAGAVMQSIGMSGELGVNTLVLYRASITNANVIMSDGKSLEHTGVIPDVQVTPSAEDLAKGRDPVLAKALELFGNSISPEQAGKIFPDDTWDD